MAKQLNIDMRFNADVSAAKAQLQSLQTSLNQLTTGMAAQGTQLGITPKLQEAQQAAVQLKAALNQSMNVETGKFDLSKFNSSLKSMNTDLGKLKTQLTNLGPQGQQTFMTLAQSIMTAEIPTKRISASLAALGTTLKNTAKWQLSSSMLHGFMSAVQTSYRYAQDLNASLNNIRIVTGESAEAMDKFAARANKAAKALSASTLDYTDAALIFYQQGLQGKDVEERAEITLKMANVSRQSAEIVSDQLTAVWNNFANGTDSLESFADKMVALGAATASSSDEIAGGLEKFAAVGETIGLSFDYAAAALATITSNTRQSEEVVGTALKTIFARIQGLNLGETLEDGTTLNKYSQALETVGVHIYNANGGLKNMDTILDETAAKWNTLTDDQQAALAQTVAGIRQYNQFIALMDNWESKGVGDKDSMKANLDTINESAGALQEQADIYAESWEAANKRVKASAEEIYMDLLDDDFFIDLTDGLADFLGLLDNLLDSMGGARGLLTGLSSILLNMFAGSAAKGLENMVYNFRSFVGLAQKEAITTQNTAMNLIKQSSATAISSGMLQNSESVGANLAIAEQATLKQQLVGLSEKLSEEEKEVAAAIIEQNGAYGHQLVLMGQRVDKANATKEEAKEPIFATANAHASDIHEAFDNIDTDVEFSEGIIKELNEIEQKFIDGKIRVEEYQDKLGELSGKAGKAGFSGLRSEIDSRAGHASKIKTDQEYRETSDARMSIQSREDILKKNSKASGLSGTEVKDVRNYIKASQDARVETNKFGKAQKEFSEHTKNSSEDLNKLGNTTRKWSQTMVGAAQGAMSLSFAISSLNSLKTTWADETIGTGEKLLQTFMSLGMAIPMLINGVNSLKNAYMGSATVQNALLLLEQRKIASMSVEAIMEEQEISREEALIVKKNAKMMVGLLELGFSKKKIAAMTAEQLHQKTGMALDEAELVISKLKSGANLAEALSETSLAGAKGLGAIATKVATVANWGFLASMTPLLAITLVLIAALAGLALIIWGVTAAFKAIVNSTPEAKLKAAKEESQALSEQLNKAKEEANNLKAAFDDYDEVAKKLSECTKGTEEWNEALQENNNKVLELMDKYPKLASTPGAIGIGKDGQLVISENARKDLIKEANARVATAQYADSIGKQKVRDMEIDQLEKDVNKKATRAETTYEYTGQNGTNYDRSYTTSTKQVDTNAKKIFDAAANKYGTNNIGVDEVNAIIKELKASNQLDKGLNDSKLRDQTMDLVNSEKELADAVRANTVATQAETAASASAIMANNEDYQKSEYKGNIDLIVGANGFNQDSITVGNKTFEATGDQSAEQVLANDYKNRVADSNWWSFGAHATKDANAVFDEYLQHMGMDRSKMENLDFTGDAVYYNAIDPITGEISDKKTKIDFDTIATTLAAKDAKQGAADYGAVIAEQMKSFENQDQADIFTAAATGNSGLLSEELLAKNEEQIEDIINKMKISDKTLEKMGFTAEDYGGNIDEAREAFKKQEKEIVKQEKAYRELKTNGIATVNEIALKAEGSAEKIADFSSSLGKSLGIENMGELSQEFIAENEGLITDYLNGVEGKAEELRKKITQNVAKIQLGIDTDSIQTELNGEMITLSDWIANFPIEDLKVGASLDDTEYYAALQSMIDSGQITVDEANKILDGLGFEPEVTYLEVPMDETSYDESTSTYTYTDPVTGEQKQAKVESKLQADQNGMLKIPVINGSKTKFRGTPSTSANSIGKNNKDSPGTINPKDTGGGKNTPKDKTFKEKDKKETKLYEDEFDRYYDITQALEEYNRELEETQERKDELWGADKLAAMDAEKKKLSEITVKQKEYLKAISGSENGTFKGGFLKTDIDALKQLDSDAKFDENGKLINYEELTQKWLNELNSAQEIWNTGMENATKTFNDNKESDNADETYDNTKTALDDDLEKAEDIYEKRKAALDKWQETYDLNEEEKQKLEDYLRQRRQLNYEELEYKLEIRVELNENDIADIEHQLERLGDNNVYASAERIALIEKNAVSYRNIADAQIEAIKEAETLYQQYLASDGKEGISKEDYMARLQESKEALQEAEMSIRDGIAQIGDELENTFDLVDEKLDQQFTKFDQLIELMDHYKNVVSLTEGEASYKEFNKILKASQEVLRDRIAADESEVAMWESRRKQLEADIATLPEDSPAKREAEEALQAIMEKEADAKSQLMADIEQLGEYAREIFENSIEQAMKDFEDEMFGRPLNSIIESIEMMNSRQEELLTTTNKIYETNKLIRNVEKDIEATTNNRAKQAYLEFQNKVKQKQEQNELTKFELDLLTAEYEMTKAQIALEEAQDAKDTVRLTRDAEGNYGYVYTANEDKVTDAEQALDDATNNYYNTALEGAQKYQDQIYQHIQEWEEKVKEVYLDQTLSEEEKNKKIKEINDTYNTLITQDKNLYYMAVGAMQESAYNTQVDYDLKGIESAENWFTECDSFLSDLEDAQDEYDRNTKEVSDHTEENFGKMSTAIRNTKRESEYLKDQIVDELVPELDTTLKDSIDNATEAWWKYIEALQEVIKLTDEAMKKNHDTQLKEGYKDNYAAEIQERLANGADYSDYDIQRLLEYRWEKLGGKDDTDYAALIAGGGTPEQIALWEVLRRWKIEQTDWSASDADYADEMREDKLDQDYAQLIIDYLTSSSYGRWSDSQVQKYLRERQIKIDERNMQGQVMSNQELKDYVAKQVGKKPEELLTGGYTGSWGPEGKLAVLHEKELVLNAEDTKNFLSATGILREISQMLDRDALIASLGAINLRAMTLNSPADQVLQQEVTIHADFPNVTDHNEIEIAIDNLINAASQHAYRT